MSAILCVAARHLNTLCPQSTKYSHESMQLMAKTVRPFRRNLSRSLTKDNCEALMGTALLVNYISWLDLGFLDGVTSAPPDSAAGVGAAKFDLSQDPLCFLSPGILQVWFQAIPVFIDHGSVFGLVVHQNPRLAIEEALAKRGEDPARFVEPLMRIWDDPRYHQTWACTAPYTGSADRGPTSYAWRLLRGLDTELSRCRSSLPPGATAALVSEGGDDAKQKLVQFRDAVTRITTGCCIPSATLPADTSMTTSPPSTHLARSSFESIARCISPLLCCASLAASASSKNNTAPAVAAAAVAADPDRRSDSTLLCPRREDIEQLIYGFPILCCGPFTELMTQGDSRALLLLVHFYRAARVLLDSRRCWWASARSGVMEGLILRELESRGLEPWLRILVT
ncbi:hypothetical protein CLAIMM_01487 [Cladophialophora immunda]|nr:hypothetical protein CLAIMM_01487 [Cladophialophora immunda]